MRRDGASARRLHGLCFAGILVQVLSAGGGEAGWTAALVHVSTGLPCNMGKRLGPGRGRLSCLQLRGGGRGGGGAGGLWRDMPAPRPIAQGKARLQAGEAKDRARARGPYGLPSQHAPGFEDTGGPGDEEEEEEDGATANPRVLARRRRNRERRQRLIAHRREQEEQERKERLHSAVCQMTAGCGVIAYFRSKTGRSKAPAVMTAVRFLFHVIVCCAVSSICNPQSRPCSSAIRKKLRVGACAAVRTFVACLLCVHGYMHVHVRVQALCLFVLGHVLSLCLCLTAMHTRKHRCAWTWPGQR